MRIRDLREEIIGSDMTAIARFYMQRYRMVIERITVAQSVTDTKRSRSRLLEKSIRIAIGRNCVCEKTIGIIVTTDKRSQHQNNIGISL